MYNFDEVKDDNGSKYFKHGVNEDVTLDSIEYRPSDKGGNAKIMFKKGTDSEKMHFIFPFKPYAGSSKTEAEQENEYTSNIAHFVTRGTGLTTEEFKGEMRGIKSFEDMVERISMLINTHPKKKFALMLINDNKTGYNKVPSWKGGFASYDAAELKSKWNEEKYGKKKAPSNTEIPPLPQTTSLDELFASGNSAKNSHSVKSEAIDDDIPF